MALLAEEVVEEWLNRQGLFTIRGIKAGQGEIDLLAVRHSEQGSVEGWHVEVQVSIRPIGYIASHRDKSASNRAVDKMRTEVEDWVSRKFKAERKEAQRQKLWPTIQSWGFKLVYGEVKDREEVEMIRQAGVQTIYFGDVLREMFSTPAPGCSAATGKDLVELITTFGPKVSPNAGKRK